MPKLPGNLSTEAGIRCACGAAHKHSPADGRKGEAVPGSLWETIIVTLQPTATDGDRSCAKKGPRVRSAAWGLPPTVAGAEVTPQGRLRVGEQAIELSCRLFLVGAANRRVNISSTWQRGARTPRRRAMRGNGEEPLIALHAARLWHHADVELTLGLKGAYR